LSEPRRFDEPPPGAGSFWFSLTMQAVGYALLVLGVLGLVLPVLQGILFIVAGLLVLSRYARWARRSVDWLQSRHPAVARAVTAAEGLTDRLFGRLAVLFGVEAPSGRDAARERR
jgi:hypothetical protein